MQLLPPLRVYFLMINWVKNVCFLKSYKHYMDQKMLPSHCTRKRTDFGFPWTCQDQQPTRAMPYGGWPNPYDHSSDASQKSAYFGEWGTLHCYSIVCVPPPGWRFLIFSCIINLGSMVVPLEGLFSKVLTHWRDDPSLYQQICQCRLFHLP